MPSRLSLPLSLAFLCSLPACVAVRVGGGRISSLRMNLFDALTSSAKRYGPPVVMGEEELMSQKAHGTSATPVQKDLRWSCRDDLADQICNFNRHYAENAGYWERSTTFLKEEGAPTAEGEVSTATRGMRGGRTRGARAEGRTREL